MPKLKKHTLYKVHWLDAASDSKWTNEADVKKYIEKLEKGMVNYGLFLFETSQMYVFASGATKDYLEGNEDAENEDLFDFFAVPKKMILSIKKA